MIFSDEKEFHFDGPDGYQYYWHCLKNEEELYSARQMKEGSLIVWLVVVYKGRTSLFFLNGWQKHTDYIEVLHSGFLSCASELREEEEYKFQQDGASIHTAKRVKNWFDANNVWVLSFSDKSSDLNIVENVWVMLLHQVYAGGKQFEFVNELREALNTSWETFCLTKIRSLYHLLPNRVFEVIKAKGKRIPY